MRRASLEYPTAYGRGYKTFSIPRMQEHVHDTGTRIFAIGEDKSLHAGLIASHIDHTRTSIDYLFRFRDMQTHGVGKLLLKHYLQDCLQYADYETINLEVVSNNMPARVLYESIGFVATRNVKGRGHKLLAMELDTRRAIEQAITQLDAFSV